MTPLEIAQQDLEYLRCREFDNEEKQTLLLSAQAHALVSIAESLQVLTGQRNPMGPSRDVGQRTIRPDSGRLCPAVQSTSPPRDPPSEYWCNLPRDHEGDHEAWGGPRTEPANRCARWPQ